MGGSLLTNKLWNHATNFRKKMVTQSNPSTPKSETAENLIKHSNTIFWGSLALHVVFGGIMGFCARLAVAETRV